MRQCTRLPNGAEMNGFRGAARFLTSLHIFEGASPTAAAIQSQAAQAAQGARVLNLGSAR